LDLDVEEYEGVEEVDAKGVDPISMLPKYIPSWKGKAKATKDLDSGKFGVSTPLLSEQVTFEGPKLAHFPLFKIDERYLTDH